MTDSIEYDLLTEVRQIEFNIDGEPLRKQFGVDENILSLGLDEAFAELFYLTLDDNLPLFQVEGEQAVLLEEPAIGRAVGLIDFDGKIKQLRKIPERNQNAIAIQVSGHVLGE